MKEHNFAQKESKWYIVQCKAGRERCADLMLKSLGVVTYFPLLKKHKNRVPIYVPLFPGYLCIKADLKMIPVSSINYCPSILRILSFGDGPIVLEDEIVESISQELERLNNQPNGSHNFQLNDILRVKNGPLRGMEVVFIGPTTPSLRVRVFLEFLGGSKETFMNAGALEKVSVEVRGDKKNNSTKQRYTRGNGRKI